MTNEEAIELLYDIQTDAVYNVLSDEKEALEMAIKALEKQPCDDCISREATIEAISKKYIGGKGAMKNAPINDLYADGLEEAVDAVWDMPSVTPEAKTGRWVAQDIHNCHTDFKCSACGYIHSFMHLYGKPTADYTYCPNCGARMAESEKGDI